MAGKLALLGRWALGGWGHGEAALGGGEWLRDVREPLPAHNSLRAEATAKVPRATRHSHQHA